MNSIDAGFHDPLMPRLSSLFTSGCLVTYVAIYIPLKVVAKCERPLCNCASLTLLHYSLKSTSLVLLLPFIRVSTTSSCTPCYWYLILFVAEALMQTAPGLCKRLRSFGVIGSEGIESFGKACPLLHSEGSESVTCRVPLKSTRVCTLH